MCNTSVTGTLKHAALKKRNLKQIYKLTNIVLQNQEIVCLNPAYCTATQEHNA